VFGRLVRKMARIEKETRNGVEGKVNKYKGIRKCYRVLLEFLNVHRVQGVSMRTPLERVLAKLVHGRTVLSGIISRNVWGD
jgi:hypothetical protein